MKVEFKFIIIMILMLFMVSFSYIYAIGNTENISREIIVNNISIAFLVAVIIIYITIFLIYDKDKISLKHVYFRDIPDDLDTEIAEYIYSGKVSSKTIWSTFLNLVNKGVYSLEKSTNSVGIQTYNIKYVENNIKLPSCEKDFVKWLNDFIDEETNLIILNHKIKNCKNTSFIDKFTIKIKEEKEKLFEPIITVSQSITKLLIILYIFILISIMFLSSNLLIGIITLCFAGFTSGIYSIIFAATKNRIPIIFILIHYLAFQLVILVLFMQCNLLMLFPVYLLSYWLIFYSLRANKKSKSEVEFLGKLKALKKYLNEFSYISNKELDSNIVWEKYYAMAIALNINKKNKNYFSDGIDSDIFDLYTQF
ncbi:MAG: DUF2207 domain-containing protein [Clostridia bacterium]|nr:DUF2207 domain-containing protein [Clostridia bacterium]MDD4386767.1 DUF2207 domain-containing protein [Clostridia bacterium]